MGAYRQLIKVDHSANDSDKQWEVPTLVEWRIDACYVDFTPGGTNRVIAFDYGMINDDDGTINIHLSLPALNTNANNQEWYVGIRSLGVEPSETKAKYHYIPLPNIWIPGGWVFHVWENTAAAATADDMLVSVFLSERDRPS